MLRFLQLLRPEIAIFAFLGLLLAYVVSLGLRTSARIDLPAYAAMVGAGLAIVAFGLFLRSRGYSRLGLSVPAFGLYAAYGALIALACYLSMPSDRLPIDPLLSSIDEHLGFSWVRYVSAFTDWPLLSRILGVIYASSLVQLCAVMFLLGKDRDRLDLFMFTGLISCTLTCVFWTIFPSAGPSSLFSLPDGLASHLWLIVDDKYGDAVSKTIIEGPTFISPWADRGLIAFPSFHTVMALLAVWFLRGKGLLFICVLLINILMLPAILLHGGHHLVDIIGGVCMFAISLSLAKICLPVVVGRVQAPIHSN